VSADWPDLRRFQSHHGCGVTIESDKLDLIGITVEVNVDHGTDVPCLKSLTQKGRCEYYSIVFLYH
jgi:hypothetical protein